MSTVAIDTPPSASDVINPATTTSSSSTSSAAPVNPLLSRGKLKKANPSNKNKKNKKGSSSTTTPNEEPIRTKQSTSAEQVEDDQEVLDLADQLLLQLDSTKDDHSKPPLTSSALSPVSTTTSSSTRVHSRTPSVSSSTGGGGASTTREKLHDMKNFLLPNSMAHHIHLPGHHHHHHHETTSSSSSSTPGAAASASSDSSKGMSRQKLRKMRKEKDIEMVRRKAREEVEMTNDQSIELERRAILEGCQKMGVRVKEMNPDGHCLYSAIADQANFLKLSQHKETYATTRKHAADYMRSHQDDFLPFLESSEADEALMTPDEYEQYCRTVESTAEWGGEPEIKALSKHFNTQIHVLQAGTDLLRIGEDLPLKGNELPMRISYHRKMYGLGEHYNSLVPASYTPNPPPEANFSAAALLV